MLRKKITGVKYFSDATKQMTNLNIATPIDKKDINFGSSDILLAKDVVKLTSNTHSEDIDKLKTSVQSINKQIINDQKNIAKNAGDISTLNSKFTGLFEVVEVLPDINDAQFGKIYCVKDASSSEDNNKYIEWVKIKTADNTYKFEKVGEFNTEPDLSSYAKLDSPIFTGNVDVSSYLHASTSTIGALEVSSGITTGYLKVNTIRDNYGSYLHIEEGGAPSDPNYSSPTKTYTTDGGLAEIGPEESFKFTLEDGSIVTKSIRVVSTTNS